MNCSICNDYKKIYGTISILLFLLLGMSTQSIAQECVSDPALLVKWDFTNAQECNGLEPTKRRYWKADVPLMTGGNQYCPQINNGAGQAIIYEKGFGNTNDFQNVMCVAGFWKNSGNKYFRAPGYDANSPRQNVGHAMHTRAHSNDATIVAFVGRGSQLGQQQT
ncbi:MAG: hypothetical protein AAF242_04605, partial [Bacteroidota bacterium]